MINEKQNQFSKSKQLNVCIVGGGNIGSLLLGDIGSKSNVSVRLFTSSPEKWNDVIDVCSIDNSVKYSGKIDLISNKPQEVIGDADIILFTVPSNIFLSIFLKIKPFIKPKTWVGVMPGNGGIEFYAKEIAETGCTLFGFQRVHGISRVKEYGKSVYDLGKKREVHIAAIPSERTTEVCSVMEGLLDLACNPLPNYLNITLTPSNPILHTTRLYSLFHDYHGDLYWDRIIDFYEEWTNESSRMLIACDEELQKLCSKLKGLDLTGVKSLKEHYESKTPEMLTDKISNIPAFKGIKSPMLKAERGYIPDFQSRYFLEDFPYGLCIIKGFCDVVGIDTPAINKVLLWYEKIAGVSYYRDGEFNGVDLVDLPLPQNYGLKSIEDIIKYYM